MVETTATRRILIVDDDPVQRRLMEAQLNRLGFETETAEDGEQGLARLNASGGRPIDLVMLDMMMPGLDGTGVLAEMVKQGLRLPVIVQTAKGSIETAVTAMRAGAFDFIVKPPSPERLSAAITQAFKVASERAKLVPATMSPETASAVPDDIVVRSPAMQQVMNLARKAAASGIPVFLEGESGSGKEVVARAIRRMSNRGGSAFVPVNCGAIPEKLVESVLFGHEKGAFTGATEKHPGKFAEADGGTLFLDEIGDLPLDAQVKLLRAVQTGEIDPVGARKPRKVDVRLITATHRDLSSMVAEGGFREDLFYRLNIFPIRVPPLRERVADIGPLAFHFIDLYAARAGRSKAPSLSPQTLAMLEAYDWPGNIRQLENAVFRALVLCDRDVMLPSDFPQIALESGGVMPDIGSAPSIDVTETDLDLPRPGNLATGGSGVMAVDLLDEAGSVRSMAAIEADILRQVIGHCGGRMSTVARSLGIGRSTLYRKIAEYGLGDPVGED